MSLDDRKFCADNFEKKNYNKIQLRFDFITQFVLKNVIFKDFIKYLNIETIAMFKNQPILLEILCRYD